MRVGFVGLGHMGAPMSGNVLAAGHDLVVYDVRPDAAADLLAAGASWADSPRQAGADRDVVITMLPGPSQVEEVLLGPGGLLAGLAAGATWIDMSTSVPAVADKVRALAGSRITVLDAPVAGGVTGARDGRLQIFVGGATEDFVRMLPLLEVMGDGERILHAGLHGAGYTVKLMLNLLWFASVALTAEALTIGVKAGVDVATLRRSLLASAAASHFLEHDVLSVLERGDFDESFAVALACKDLGLAVDLARQTGVPAEMSALVEQIYRRARAQYGDEGGQMLPMKLLEDLTATPLRLSSAPAPPSPPPSPAPSAPQE